MAGTNRSARPDVICGDDAARFNFFQLVELIYRHESVVAESLPQTHEWPECIRFKASASLGFPIRDVQALARTAEGGHQLEVAFLGLHGSQSPLPGYYLDQLAWEYAQNEQRLGLFLDFFHHRLLVLLHRVWRKYRYHVRFQGQGEDGFSKSMFALAGLGDERLRRHLPVAPAKLLACAGLLASPARSGDVIAGLVAHCFDLVEVVVKPWLVRPVAIAREQQHQLGVANAALGEDVVIGSRTRDCSGKFLLSIRQLDYDRFLQFLPNGSQFAALQSFVRCILRDQLAWDIELCLAPEQARGLLLGDSRGGRLGWCTFLGHPPVTPRITIGGQE